MCKVNQIDILQLATDLNKDMSNIMQVDISIKKDLSSILPNGGSTTPFTKKYWEVAYFYWERKERIGEPKPERKLEKLTEGENFTRPLNTMDILKNDLISLVDFIKTSKNANQTFKIGINIMYSKSNYKWLGCVYLIEM